MEFPGIWESMHNPAFKSLEFEGFWKQTGLSRFSMSPTKWVEATSAEEEQPEE